MKARRFFAFIAGAAMLFGVSGCTELEGEGDSAIAEITVTPSSFATDLEGGEQVLTVTCNGTWTVSCDQTDVTVEPLSGTGNGTVTVTVPAVTAARNFSIKFEATKQALVQGIPYPSTAKAAVAVYQNEGGDTSIATNVKAVRDLLKNMTLSSTAVAVTDEIAAMTITGVVVGCPAGNMGNDYLLAIQDDSTAPGCGLTINHNKAANYNKGDVISVSLSGAQAQLYYGTLQVKISDSAEITKVGEPITVEPIEVTMANILDHESQYVKINNVVPAKAAVGKPWNEGTKGVNVATTVDGKKLVVRVNGGASFKDELVPAKKGALCGVSSIYNKDAQILPQFTSDIQLTEEAPELLSTLATIAEITEVGAYKVENAWVVGFTGNGVILTDASGAFINVYIYGNEHKTIGEKMTVDGDVQIRQGGFQFNSPAVTVLDGTATVSYPTPNQYEGAALEALCEKYATANASYLAEYVELKGVVTKSEAGHYGIVFSGVDNSKYEASLSKTPDAALGLDAVIGKSVIMRGFVTDYELPYLGVVAVSIEEDANAVALAASDITNVPVDGVTNATANITVVGIDTVNATFDGTIVTAASVAGNVLTYSVAKNEGEAREGWIKLSAEGVEDVTIAVKQRGTAPTGGKFVKVTGPLSDYSGTYLIIYDGREDANTGKSLITLNASLGKSVDAAGNFVKVTAESDGSIAFNETNMANAVEIAKIAGTENYSLNIAGGVYIGSTSGDKNELKFNETAPIANSISVDADGVATITSALDTAKPVTFKFYSSSNGARFRYYKSDQKMPSLYKLVE